MSRNFLLMFSAVLFLVLAAASIMASPVNITLAYPPDGQTVNKSAFNFTYLVDTTQSNCTHYLGNSSGAWIQNNQTDLAIGPVKIAANLTDGNYSWNVLCTDSINDSNNAWAANTNWTFIVNTSIPLQILINATLNSPSNGTTKNNTPFNLAYFVNILSNCTVWMSEGGWHPAKNAVVNGADSYTINSIPSGNYTWNVFCFDNNNQSNAKWAASVNWTFIVDIASGGAGGGWTFSGDMWGWNGFSFDGPPYAANGPGCNPTSFNNQPGAGCGASNDPVYDIEGIWVAGNATHRAMQIFMPNFTTSKFCGGSKNITILIQLDSDKNISSGCPSSQKCMPGANTQIAIVNSTSYGFQDWNGSSFVTNASKTSLVISPNNTNCSISPTTIRLSASLSDIGGNDPELMAVSTNGTTPFDIIFAGGMSAGGQKPECPMFDNQGEQTCMNNSKQQYGIFCKWTDDSVSANATRGWCDPDFINMPQTCDYFCGYCNTTTACNSFSPNRGACGWETAGSGFCKEISFGAGFDCSTNCMACFNENECLTKGPKDGMTSNCGWIDDTLSPQGGFCDNKLIADQKDCSKNCFACTSQSDCSASAVNGQCAWIGNETDWSAGNKGNYTAFNYTGFVGCVGKSLHPEICFMPGDEDGDGNVSCADSECNTDPFCGYGIGGAGAAGGGAGMMGYNCFQYDGNQAGCAGDANCFWHTAGGEGLCDPVFMKNMMGGMSMDVPPVPIGEDSNDTNEAWLDILHVGIKEEPDSVGIGIALRNITTSSACYKFDIMNGTQNSSYNRFIDIDENSGNGCTAQNETGTITGFEYKFEHIYIWNGTDTIENKVAYKCSSSNWIPYAAQTMSIPDSCFIEPAPFDPVRFKGADVIIIKYADIGNPDGKLRIFVSSGTNSSNRKDYAGPFFYKKGSIDFKPIDCFANPASCGLAFMKTGGQYMPFEDCMMPGDEDDDGLSNCDDADCSMVPWCNYNFGNDTTAPTVTSTTVDVFDDFAFLMWNTNEPTNGTLELFRAGTCSQLNRTNIFHELGDSAFTFDDYKPFHGIPLKNNTRDSNNTLLVINPSSTYYYKTTSCDKAGNCAYSGCSNFTTKTNKPQINFGFDIPGQTNDTLTGQIMPYLINSAGNQTNLNGTFSMNYTNNATLRFTNPNATNQWSIDFEGIDVSKASTINLTNVMNVQSSGGKIFVGMNATAWQQMSQTLGVNTIKLTIPQTFDSTNRIQLKKCDESLGNCQNSSMVWVYNSTSGNASKTGENSSDYCQLTNWSFNPNSTIWKCPTSLGFSVFAVYMVEAGSTTTTITTTSTSSTSGGGSSPMEAGKTYAVNDADFEAGYTKEVSTNEKISFSFSGESHSITLNSITATSATITVASTPQTATLNIGDEKKFEINRDSSYDLYVKLNSIINGKASLTIKKISEAITQNTVQNTSNGSTSENSQTKTPAVESSIGGGSFMLWTGLAAAIVGIILFFAFKKKSAR